MKKKLVLLAAIATAMGLAGCGGSGSKGEINLWVGVESVEFYQTVTKEYTDSHPDFGYTVKVIAADTGTVGGTMLADNTQCGDIITIAHDNIGKLAQKTLVKPLTEASLLAQIEDDNPDEYKTVIKSVVGTSADKYVIGSPYISQALFLMYNKQYVSEEQAKSFEGLQAAALAARTEIGKSDVHGCTLTGTDGFNFSFTLLARKASDNSTTLKIYEGLDKTNTWCQGEDTVAVARWGQRVFEDGTLTWPNDSGHATMMQTKTALSVVGGAWHYNAIKAAIGEENVGISLIPEFTLTEADVAGTSFAANTKMRGGTFADCKCFVINAASEASKYNAEQELIKFLSSKDIQNRSFKACTNVPAYKNAMEYIESVKSEVSAGSYAIAKAQSSMVQYGVPQPFVTATLNNYYYQAGGPDLYKNLLMLDGTPEDASIDKVRQVLYTMNYIWMFGNGTVDKMTIPTVLPAVPVKAQ